MPAPDRRVHTRDVVAQGDPDLFVVDAMVGVRGDDPHALDFAPRNLRRRLNDLVRQLGGNVAESADNGLARQAQWALSVPARLPKAHKLGCCIGRLSKICQKVVDASGHRSTASARMWSSRGLRALRATMSTPTPRSSSRSWNRPT